MGQSTRYIVDAIKQHGPETKVKVLLNGQVVEIGAKVALTQLHKPVYERMFPYKLISPYQEPIVEIQAEQPSIENVVAEEASDDTMNGANESEQLDAIEPEEAPKSKRKNKKSDTNES